MRRLCNFCRPVVHFGSAQNDLRERPLNAANVRSFLERFLNWRGTARDPDFQFCIQIECTGSFNRKPHDRLVRDALIIDLAARNALNIHKNQPLVRENEKVANNLVGKADMFSLDQNPVQFMSEFPGIDLRSVAHQSVKYSHFTPPAR